MPDVGIMCQTGQCGYVSDGPGLVTSSRKAINYVITSRTLDITASGLRYTGSGYHLSGHVLVGRLVMARPRSVMASPLMVGVRVPSVTCSFDPKMVLIWL